MKFKLTEIGPGKIKYCNTQTEVSIFIGVNQSLIAQRMNNIKNPEILTIIPSTLRGNSKARKQYIVELISK